LEKIKLISFTFILHQINEQLHQLHHHILGFEERLNMRINSMTNRLCKRIDRIFARFDQTSEHMQLMGINPTENSIGETLSGETFH